MSAFHMHRGDTLELAIAVKDDAGDALNITGGTLWVTVKQSLADADAAAISQVSTTSGGIVITSAATGLATATIPHTATLSLADATTLYYDVQYKDSAGRYKTVDSGTIEVVRDATRATV